VKKVVETIEAKVEAIQNAPPVEVVQVLTTRVKDILKAGREYMEEAIIPDAKLIVERYREVQSKPSKMILVRLIKKMRSFFFEYTKTAYGRYQKLSDTSCLNRYIVKAREVVRDRAAAAMGVSKEEYMTRINALAEKIRSKIVNYVDYKPDITPFNLVANSTFSIDKQTGHIQASIALPPGQMRSLRVQGLLSQRIEKLRQMIERIVAVVKAESSAPSNVRLSLIQRFFNIAQYLRQGDLRF